jgi:NAD+ diphosphatase
MPLHQIAIASSLPVYAASARAVGIPTELVSPAEGGRSEVVGYRELYGAVGDDELALVARAMQVIDWDDTTRYCPRCAAPTEALETECVKRCPSCGLTQYPRLAPAMIVGVVRDGKLLLGQSPRFRGRFHSILAGFLEPGERAE